ncbi:MAG: T9SS type A sorting domain-containing protein [Bacteroidetes bacterium]|nr:T9SS type A sorting domain-containing protein [Bacteroidota bacterium]
MKNFGLVLLALFMAQTVGAQTEWAPVGAKWWELVQSDWAPTGFINYYECTGVLDTLGHNCKVIHKIGFDGIENDFYSYQMGSKVFIYSGIAEDFVPNFDYSLQVGEHLLLKAGLDSTFFYVDSIQVKVFENDQYNVQHGRLFITSEQSETHCEVYEGIGTIYGPWQLNGFSPVAETWYSLACYQTPDGKLYSINDNLDVDCQALATPVIDLGIENSVIQPYPNPASTEFTIASSKLTAEPNNLFLFDATGKFVKLFKLADGQEVQTFPLENMPNGLYFWMLKDEQELIGSGKLAITK